MAVRSQICKNIFQITKLRGDSDLDFFWKFDKPYFLKKSCMLEINLFGINSFPKAYINYSRKLDGTRGQGGGVCPPPPDFGRSEVATGQWWHASLLLAHSYFQSLRHPWALKGILRPLRHELEFKR